MSRHYSYGSAADRAGLPAQPCRTQGRGTSRPTVTPYRTAPPPRRPSLAARLRAWWWRRFATPGDWQRAEVREAIGGEWVALDAGFVAAWPWGDPRSASTTAALDAAKRGDGVWWAPLRP